MTERRKKFLKEKLYEMYTLLYKAATPSIDFRELVSKSPWVRKNHYPKEYWNMSKEDQKKFQETFEYETYFPADQYTEEQVIREHLDLQRKIDWDNYYLDKDTYDKIVNDFINDKSNKLTATEKRQFRTEAYLGCGPSSYDKSKEEKNDN